MKTLALYSSSIISYYCIDTKKKSVYNFHRNKETEAIRMKKTMAIALVLIMMMSVVCVAHADMLSDIQAKGVLVLGANIEFPPYEFYWTNPETGAEEIAGFDMDLARGIAQQLGVELQINDQAFSGLVTALSIGEMDMVISGLAIKPERLEVVDFSDPYFSGEQILLVRAEDYDKYLTAEDLAGKKVGAQLGSLQQGILESQFAKSEPLLLDEPSVLALELMQGNIDGWLITDLVAMQYMVVYPDMFQISQVPVDYDSSAGIGVAVTKGDNASLLEIVNQYIAQVHADGTWDAWMADAVAKSASLLSEQYHFTQISRQPVISENKRKLAKRRKTFRAFPEGGLGETALWLPKERFP